MATGTFEAALADADVETTRTSAGQLQGAIADAITDPAVGVPLPGFDVDLAAAGVTVDPTPAELKRAACGVTPAEMGIVEYGSLVLPSAGNGSEMVSLFSDTHVAVIHESDVVSDMPAAFDSFETDLPATYNDAIIATGPSKTADMGALVEGVHGPDDVHAIIVED